MLRRKPHWPSYACERRADLSPLGRWAVAWEGQLGRDSHPSLVVMRVGATVWQRPQGESTETD